MSDQMLLDAEQFGPVLFAGEFYDVRQMLRPRISENMLAVWNYAVLNRALNVAEVHTDSLPGAMSILLKLDEGINSCTKLLVEAKAKRDKAESRVLLSARPN